MTTRSLPFIGLTLATTGIWGAAQTASRLRFDTVVIRPTTESRTLRDGGPGTHAPDRLSIRSDSLRSLIGEAYPQYEERLATGSRELDARYSVNAVLPQGLTVHQYSEMMANLLADRFGLKFHIVRKKFTAYELVVSPRGPHFSVDYGLAKNDRAATDVMWRVRITDAATGIGYIHCYQCSMQKLANALRNEVFGIEVSVVDKTGISGSFDFTIAEMPLRRFIPAATGGETDVPQFGGVDVHTVSAVLEKHVGLKLNAIRVLRDVMVVDHLEKLRPE